MFVKWRLPEASAVSGDFFGQGEWGKHEKEAADEAAIPFPQNATLGKNTGF
jgi:hypothetical protein